MPGARIPTPLRAATILGVILLYIWPRYFFVGIAGKGLSAYTAISIFLLLASFAILALRPAVRDAFRDAATRSWILLSAFALFWAWRLVCDTIGLTPLESYRITGLDFLYLGCWLIIGSILFVDQRVQAAVPYLIALSGIVATAFGMLEFMTGRPISDLLGFYEFAVGDQYMLSTMDTAQMRGESMRVKSLYSHPIVYGQFVASTLPIALHFILQKAGWRRILGLTSLAGIAASMLVSNSRSSVFVAVAATAVYLATFYLDFRRGSRMFVAAWLGIALLIVAPMATGYLYSIASGRTSEEAMSTGARVMQADKGHNALLARPINGFGDGNSLPIAGLKGRNNFLTVDNYYLTLAVDDGYLGQALFVLFLIIASIAGVRTTMREPETNERSLDAAYTAGIVALAVGLNIVSIPDSLSIIFLFAGLLIARSRLRPVAPIRRNEAFPVSLRPAERGTMSVRR